jgi:hypothetical protein
LGMGWLAEEHRILLHRQHAIVCRHSAMIAVESEDGRTRTTSLL